MCISPGRVGIGVILNKKHNSKKLKNVKQICLQNLNKNCLKLDSRPILYAYNLLGYGETLSEKSGKSQQMSTIFEHFQTFRKKCLTFQCNFNIFHFLKKYKLSTLFDFFQIFQKVFPRIPGGCMHKESDENRVLSICYLSVGDICFCDF